MDITSLYPGIEGAKRGIAIVDDKYVVVQDEFITGDKESLLRWTMLTSSDVKVRRNTAELLKDGQKLIIQVKGIKGVRMRTWSTVSPNDYDEDNEGTTLIGFEVKLPAKTRTNLLVELLPDGDKNYKTRRIKELNEW
ncbi:hypothetical protein EIM50_22685 [Pseudoxanthomonas sp. SGD-10]|nr:hypothetical protein EIM50_22685 [Pseudoxanthomonas sp. SGD-10]